MMHITQLLYNFFVETRKSLICKRFFLNYILYVTHAVALTSNLKFELHEFILYFYLSLRHTKISLNLNSILLNSFLFRIDIRSENQFIPIKIFVLN